MTLEYVLHEPNSEMGFVLEPSDSNFPEFLFSNHQADDGSYIITQTVFYENVKNFESRTDLGTSKDRNTAYRRAYIESVNRATSLGLKFKVKIDPTKLEYLTRKESEEAQRD